MDDAWIPIIGIICLFGLPISGWIIVRILQYRERMAMIERGIVPPPDGRSMRRSAQYWQQQQGAPGPAGPVPTYSYDDTCAPDVTLRRGIRTTMIGIAVFIGLSFIGWDGSDNGIVHWHPGPWLLGGLVPMFVGIAQIVNALLSGAQFSVMRPPSPPPGPAAPPPPYPNGAAYPNYGPPPQPGSPGPQYEELKRPVPPPDRR